MSAQPEMKVLVLSLSPAVDEGTLRRMAEERFPKWKSSMTVCQGMDLFRACGRITRPGMETLADLWDASLDVMQTDDLTVLLFSDPRWGLWSASVPPPRNIRFHLISGPGEDARPTALWGQPAIRLVDALREMEKERFFSHDLETVTRKIKAMEEKRLEAQTRHREEETAWAREMESVSGDLKRTRTWLARFQVISAAAVACAFLAMVGIWTCVSDPNIPARMNRTLMSAPTPAASAPTPAVPASADVSGASLPASADVSGASLTEESEENP